MSTDVEQSPTWIYYFHGHLSDYNMKSKIKYESNVLKNEVLFPNVTAGLYGGKLTNFIFLKIIRLLFHLYLLQSRVVHFLRSIIYNGQFVRHQITYLKSKLTKSLWKYKLSPLIQTNEVIECSKGKDIYLF